MLIKDTHFVDCFRYSFVRLNEFIIGQPTPPNIYDLMLWW